MQSKLKICFLIIIVISSCKDRVDYYNLDTFSKNESIRAVIEIPAGTNKKFEYHKESNSFKIDKKDGVDRVISFLPYPGNYGFIPSTLSNPNTGGDGDALDVLVLSETVSVGTVVDVIPIAILKLIDNDELDYKIIAIPTDKRKQIIKASNFNDFNQKYPEAKKIIETWFLNYNPTDTASIDGWGDHSEALKEIHHAKKAR